jgi:hypothetical protein
MRGKPLRTWLIIVGFGIAAAAQAGESPYRQHVINNDDYMAGCHRVLKQAEDSVGITHPANMSHVQKFLEQARAAEAAGKGLECMNRANDAMHWET